MIPEEHRHAVKCFLQWLHIREQNGQPLPGSSFQLSLDAWHSALLQRLLEGLPAYPVAPPLTEGEPWYELFESGSAICSDVTFAEDGHTAYIQGSPWQIVSQRDDACLVTYAQTAPLFQLSPVRGTRYDTWQLRRVSDESQPSADGGASI